MSNYLGIAIVTKALHELVQSAIQTVMPGIVVQIGPPRIATPGEREVNLYLYQLDANAAMRNADLPRSHGRSELADRATVAIDLHYLISFSGEQHLATEVMLGKVLTALHLRQSIAVEEIVNIARADGTQPLLAAAPIPAADEIIRLSPEYPSLEELTKLWTVFFQIAHRPSLYYLVSGVLLADDEAPPHTPPPLRVLLAGTVA